ncbi:trypsin-like serine peptidase [Sphingomonas sp. IC4-52]|uniref:trypsin-like serine peptidase n=1 Tax=Sphingomonas sp. IC4-52 TaxID=2887202 RepID=UPI001D0FE2E0|nr:serine protease [Sphingomonas sp. IC4-52]MCC2981223.1 serine protease [Sphingomonas sp. IC4-52]
MPHQPELAELIRDAGVAAWTAWSTVRVGISDTLPSADGLRAAADLLGQDADDLLASTLLRFQLVESFRTALETQGVRTGDLLPTPDPGYFDEEALGRFLVRSRAIRCLILKNGEPSGSGVLVAPALVLTAWHVIAVGPPGADQEPAPLIQVRLADGRVVAAEYPATEQSSCTLPEWRNAIPGTDEEFTDYSDVALLRLREPAGATFGFARLGASDRPWPGRQWLTILQYPEGEYRGISFGRTQKIRGLTARWAHDAAGAAGSSGGGCFDTSFLLAGIHQGRAADPSLGRMVPTARFPPTLVRRIETGDVAPLWSLGGTPDAPLVIGRSILVDAFRASTDPASRARGIWIKRTNWRSLEGLGFSFRVLGYLVSRTPDVRIVLVSFDALVSDHVQEVARRVTEAGFPVPNPEAPPGTSEGQTQPEAVVAVRARLLAEAIDEEARRRGVRLFVFLEHPNVVFGDAARWAVAAFAEAVLKLDAIRVVLAGYEPMQFAGAQLQVLGDAQGAGPPGLMVEFLRGFTRQEVERLIATACAALGEDAHPQRVSDWADQALEDLPVGRDGTFAPALGRDVGERLRPKLEILAARLAEEAATRAGPAATAAA